MMDTYDAIKSLLDDDEQVINLPNVSRVVVVTGKGRLVDKRLIHNNLTISVQDDGKTIKLFIKD